MTFTGTRANQDASVLEVVLPSPFVATPIDLSSCGLLTSLTIKSEGESNVFGLDGNDEFLAFSNVQIFTTPPTMSLTGAPSASPSAAPTMCPTGAPSASPIFSPSAAPTPSCSGYDKTVTIKKTRAPKVVKAGGVLQLTAVLRNSQKVGNITAVGVQVQLPAGVTQAVGLQARLGSARGRWGCGHRDLACHALDRQKPEPSLCACVSIAMWPEVPSSPSARPSLRSGPTLSASIMAPTARYVRIFNLSEKARWATCASLC